MRLFLRSDYLRCALSTIFLCAILGSIFFLTQKIAMAGPPFLTDDPEPVEYRHWEVYVATQYIHSRDQDSATLPHLEINYGVMPNVQIHLIAPFNM